ncbi:MAG: hypothetical protein J3K34DRAFT_466156 [Monoraphidium minutum]|nr:MAG: hypothetical protein J3K34DRAFT_466156 [Monoraphidium minutum]
MCIICYLVLPFQSAFEITASSLAKKWRTGRALCTAKEAVLSHLDSGARRILRLANRAARAGVDGAARRLAAPSLHSGLPAAAPRLARLNQLSVASLGDADAALGFLEAALPRLPRPLESLSITAACVSSTRLSPLAHALLPPRPPAPSAAPAARLLQLRRLELRLRASVGRDDGFELFEGCGRLGSLETLVICLDAPRDGDRGASRPPFLAPDAWPRLQVRVILCVERGGRGLMLEVNGAAPLPPLPAPAAGAAAGGASWRVALTRLRRLTLRHLGPPPLGARDGAALAAAHAPALTRLELAGWGGDAVAALLAAAPWAAGLEEISLDECCRGADRIGTLGGFGGFGYGGTRPRASRAAAALAAAPLPRLRALRAAACRLEPDDAATLAAAPWAPQLTSLDLSRNYLGHAGLLALANGPLEALDELTLCNIGLDAAGMAQLAAAPWADSLRALRAAQGFRSNAGADACAAALGAGPLAEAGARGRVVLYGGWQGGAAERAGEARAADRL